MARLDLKSRYLEFARLEWRDTDAIEEAVFRE